MPIGEFSRPAAGTTLPTIEARGRIIRHTTIPWLLFTQPRRIGILGSSLAESWIRPRNTPGITSPDAPHSPVPLDLVTPVDSYAGLCMPLCVRAHQSRVYIAWAIRPGLCVISPLPKQPLPKWTLVGAKEPLGLFFEFSY
jgi:hypothetical protein